MAAYEILLLNTAIPQIQAAQSGDTYVVPRDIAFSAALTLSAGTANGVAYLNGSKVLTTGSALTFDGTNFGVGSNAPGQKFVVNGASGVAMQLENSSDSNRGGRFVASGSAASGTFAVNTTSSGYALTFGIDSNEQMRLTSTGLGIGTSLPLSRIHGVAPDNLSDDHIIRLGFLFDSSSQSMGSIGTHNDSSDTGGLKFSTASSGVLTERARITSGGIFLIGTDANLGLGTSIEGGRIHCRRSSGESGIFRRDNTTGTIIDLQYDGASIGTISTNGTNAAYNTSSDYRLKNITGPITNSGAYIDSLNPVEGTWKADGSTFVGLIAHEVQEASRTNVATGVKDGPEIQGMDYSNAELIANLIAEIQSLRARVAALEAN